jgi:pseudaminic acid biosynthesis-associated methylase
VSGIRKTDQERFWEGPFGDEYTRRNDHGFAALQHVLTKALSRAENFGSCLEIGCNIGLNLDALRAIRPNARLVGVEINASAVRVARSKGHAVVEGSILDDSVAKQVADLGPFDVVFTKGVLIHIAPEYLPSVYASMMRLSSRYLMVCEYYNPTPVTVPYRGNSDRLFKRDFAGDLLESFPLRLLDYGFQYRRDPEYPADDLTYFLLEKR